MRFLLVRRTCKSVQKKNAQNSRRIHERRANDRSYPDHTKCNIRFYPYSSFTPLIFSNSVQSSWPGKFFDESKTHGFFSGLYPEEFEDLKHRLQNFNIIHIITHDSRGENEIGRLDQTKLEKMLKGWGRKSDVFVCGPFEMMKEMIRAVKKIGFSSARVYKEEFKL